MTLNSDKCCLCDGTGNLYSEGGTCSYCDGWGGFTGSIAGADFTCLNLPDCSHCNNSGHIAQGSYPCPNCNGTGITNVDKH
jgi:DnaJ-class molecular chaperone